MVGFLFWQSLGGAPLDFTYKPPPAKPVQSVEITDPFLLQNAKRDGVKMLPSGVQIEMITEGYGRFPNRSDKVVINYTGYLTDGTMFDTSTKNPEPATFPVSGVVPGFAEGLMNVRMGGRAKIYIPSHLAYGSKGSGKRVPPDSTLIFEIEILDVIE